jgi:hypothetical protein
MKKFGWLAVTLVGTAISLYGNHRVQKAVREEIQERQAKAVINAFNQARVVSRGVTEDEVPSDIKDIGTAYNPHSNQVKVG